MATFGTCLQVEIDGVSHGKGIATFINGCPEGLKLDNTFIQQELTRRAPGTSQLVTQRKEKDEFEVQRGVDSDSVTTGEELVIWVPNQAQRSQDYARTHNILRPGHGSAVELACDPNFDQRGGGSASARLTVGHVAAGAVAQLILNQIDGSVRTLAFVSRIGDVESRTFPTDEAEIYVSQVHCPDPAVSKEMEELVRQVRRQKNSIGGQVTSVTTGFRAGVGERPFGSLDGMLAGALMDIHGVKAVEIGDGTLATRMQGSEHNDAILKREGPRLFTATNHAGGILGGKSLGEPIITRVTFKPTSSHGQPQQTVTMNGDDVILEMKGRHDPCIAIRGGEVVKAMVRLVLADALLCHLKQN